MNSQGLKYVLLSLSFYPSERNQRQIKKKFFSNEPSLFEIVCCLYIWYLHIVCSGESFWILYTSWLDITFEKKGCGRKKFQVTPRQVKCSFYSAPQRETLEHILKEISLLYCLTIVKFFFFSSCIIIFVDIYVTFFNYYNPSPPF